MEEMTTVAAAGVGTTFNIPHSMYWQNDVQRIAKVSFLVCF